MILALVSWALTATSLRVPEGSLSSERVPTEMWRPRRTQARAEGRAAACPSSNEDRVSGDEAPLGEESNEEIVV